MQHLHAIGLGVYWKISGVCFHFVCNTWLQWLWGVAIRCLGSVLCAGTMWTMSTDAVLPSLSWDRASLPRLGTARTTSPVRSHLGRECCTPERLLQHNHLLQPQWTCCAELAGFAVLLCFYQILYLPLHEWFPRYFIQYQPVELFLRAELFSSL